MPTRIKTEPAQDGREASKDQIMTIRLDASMHERLRKLSFDRRQPMRDFIVRGIEMVLKAEQY